VRPAAEKKVPVEHAGSLPDKIKPNCIIKPVSINDLHAALMATVVLQVVDPLSAGRCDYEGFVFELASKYTDSRWSGTGSARSTAHVHVIDSFTATSRVLDRTIAK
jgi:hypothetical protein